MISKFCKFSALSLEFQKFFSVTRTIFLTVGQNNFGNKIPNHFSCHFKRLFGKASFTLWHTYIHYDNEIFKGWRIRIKTYFQLHWMYEEEPSLKSMHNFLVMPVHKNQLEFEYPPIRKQHLKILINFYLLTWSTRYKRVF